MSRVTHELRFDKPTPRTEKDAQGYVLRWRGAALMGVLNVTPDSFSDGGRFTALEAALSQAKGMLEAGALILDVGGESTRPGAEPVGAEEELDRVLPVIRVLREETDALISVDTYKPEVALEAVRAGANLVNDVRGLRAAAMVAVCAEEGVPAVIMHMQGDPQTMQKGPYYEDVSEEVFAYLTEAAKRTLSAGVPSVVLDPGIGFGKTLEHNLELTRRLDALTACPERLSAVQCEYHPFLDQDPILKTARGFDMLFTSYSPLGRGPRGELLENPAVLRIAEAHGKTPAQIVLRWHLQQANVAAIPKASSEEHLRENADVFGWDLTATDMKTLYGLIKPDGRIIDPDFAPEWDTGVERAA